MSMINLIGTVFKHFQQQPGPVLKSVMYLVVSRIMLQFKYIVPVIVSELDLNLTQFLIQWCTDMDCITHHDRRKLGTLTHLGKVKFSNLLRFTCRIPAICIQFSATIWQLQPPVVQLYSNLHSIFQQFSAICIKFSNNLH